MGCGSTKLAFDDEKNAVDNWRKKREQKRLKNVKSTDHSDDDQPIITLTAEPTSKFQETKKTINESVAKPTRMLLPPPPVPVKSKSPSPQRIKGPAKIREIFIEKPIEVRGFGFKLEGGRVQNRPIYISTIEEGSPADKAGLYIDDEIVSMNDENIENMSFDQVRKILKERNLRGSIKLIVRTLEDVVDDQSQTITAGPTTDHSRTPSPQKITSPLTLPSYSVATPKTNSSISSPVSSYVQFNPISSSDTTKMSPLQQIPASSLNIFTPKPFRSTNSTNTNGSSIYDKELQDLEAEFEKQLRGIDETPIRETIINNEKQETNVTKPPTQVVVNTPQTLVDQSPPVHPIDSFVHRAPNTDNTTKQQRNDTPIAQVRSYVEKQMDQLQQDLEFGFPRSTKIPSLTSLVPTPAREQQQPVTIPIDLASASPPPVPSEFLRSSLKKSSSTQNHLDRIPSNRTYGLKIDPNEQVIHYLDPYAQQNYIKHSIPDLSSMKTHTFNDLKATIPESYSTQIINQQQQQQQQKKVTIQLDGRIPQQRITNKQLHSALNQTPRKTHFHDQVLINDEPRRQTNVKTSGRRSAPLAPPRQELQLFNYQGQQISSNVSPNRQPRTKSPARTMMENNNDRVLSVSGKLRCSRCTDELGQGSAMVIESLGLYYHIECFRCCVCNIPLASSFEGTDVRVRNNRLHCQNCFSDDNEVYRLWQIHQKTNRSIRSLVAQSLYKNKPQLLALISRVIQHRTLLQTIIDRSQLLEREKFLSNDLALILVYDQVFGTHVRGKFKGMLKRNQSSIDQCIQTLLNEQNLSSITELAELTSIKQPISTEIPRYVRINRLKTTRKKLRLNLKELSFKKIKNV
ncbi:unnamed protein product [Rotaria magnacalcarata]